MILTMFMVLVLRPRSLLWTQRLFCFPRIESLDKRNHQQKPYFKVKEYFRMLGMSYIFPRVLTITDLSIRAQQLADSRSTFDDDNYSVILSTCYALLAMEVFIIWALVFFWTFDSHDYQNRKRITTFVVILVIVILLSPEVFTYYLKTETLKDSLLLIKRCIMCIVLFMVKR